MVKTNDYHATHIELKGFSNPVIAVRKWLEPKLPADVAIHEQSYNEAVHAIGYQPYMPGRLIETIDDVQDICHRAGLSVSIETPFVYFKKVQHD